MSHPLERIFGLDLDPGVQRNFDEISRVLNPPVPQAIVFNSAAISITTSGVRQFLTFDSETIDNGDLHSTAANTGRLTAPTAGLYLIGGSVEFAANATGQRELDIRLNGATFIVADRENAAAAGTTIMSVSRFYRLNAGEYAELGVVQSSGAALNVTRQASWSPEFYMVRLAGFTNQF